MKKTLKKQKVAVKSPKQMKNKKPNAKEIRAKLKVLYAVEQEDLVQSYADLLENFFKSLHLERVAMQIVIAELLVRMDLGSKKVTKTKLDLGIRHGRKTNSKKK